MNFRLVLLLCLLKYSLAQDVTVGKPYYITSPNWPKYYNPGQTNQWQIGCPQGYNCRLECPEMRLPQSTSCSVDRLLVSLTGDNLLAGAQTYCGTRSLNVTSTGTKISIGLITSESSPGGRFRCRVSAVTATPTPQSCRCGERRQNRIVGGQETGVNEYTMMAGLIDLSIRMIICGATILTPQYVLTAAHCLISRSVDQYSVVVGEHDVNTGDSPATQLYAISKFTPHPLYSDSEIDYDIATVMVDRSIEFNDRVGPVCLPFKFINNDFAGTKVTVLGWGTLGYGAESSNVLRKVDLEVLSQSACRRQGAAVTNRQMCTYTPGKDACQNDDGGPLLYTDPATGLLFSVGLVSYGQSCATLTPGINTRITVFLDWIINNTERYDYCVK